MDTAPRTCVITRRVSGEQRPCGRQLYADEHGRYACTPCEHRMRGWLRELPAQLVVLRGSVMPERGAGQYVTRTRATAPIPCREDVLSLIAHGAPGDVHDPYGDQEGPLPITTVLGSWAQMVAEEQHLLGPEGRPSAEQLAAWLEPHLGWACHQLWIDDMYGQWDGMMREIRSKTQTQPRTRPVRRPCPRCDSLGLVQRDWEQYIECTDCGGLFTAAELEDDAPEQLAALAREAAGTAA